MEKTTVNVVPRTWKETDLVALLRCKFLNGNVNVSGCFYQKSSFCLISGGGQRIYYLFQTETNGTKAEMLMEWHFGFVTVTEYR